MAQINKPTDYFNTVLYTGNGSTQSITGVGFQPDTVWIKNRSSAYSHQIYDVVRGATEKIYPSENLAEVTDTNGLTAFDSDGFSVGSNIGVNNNTDNHVGWSWLAGGTASSNTDGSITSQVSANTTSGFSIVSYTGNGTGSATFGHGLGVKPKVIIIKNRSAVEGWGYWQDTTNNGTADIRMQLNLTDANYNNNFVTFNTDTITLPSTSDPSWNGSGNSLIAYCFAEKKGFSKFGSYTGNGNADGTFVFTGMKPAFIIIKRTDAIKAWNLTDSVRDEFNPQTKMLFPNSTDTEFDGTSAQPVDKLSNGFKIRNTDANFNASGGTYIYMAFAAEPLVGQNNIPATAR